MQPASRPAVVCACGEHAFVDLTRGRVALIDPEFAPAVSLWNWFASHSGKNWYAVRSVHAKPDGKPKTFTITLHSTVCPAPHGYLVDHRNGDTLDNRRNNLRIATVAQNAQNQGWRDGTTSKYRGVSRAGAYWRATIGLNGTQRYLGKFATEEEAARAYDAAALALHRDYARTNFERAGA